MATIAVGECINFGWTTFKKRTWFLILVPLVVFAASFCIGIATAVVVGIVEGAAGAVIQFVSSLVVNVLVSIGTITLYLKVHDAPESAKLMDFWHPEFFFKYLLAGIVLGIILILGFVLLIIPGIILSLIFAFTLYLVVDRGLGPIAALKESARLTKGNRWNLLLLTLAIILLNIVGLIALVVGLFVTVPISALAMIHAYRTLQGG